jgi:hypothetical protein
MATLLKKIVQREVPGIREDRPLIVALVPPGLISLREKGTRKTYTVTIGKVLWELAKADSNERLKEKKKKPARRRVSRGLLTT